MPEHWEELPCPRRIEVAIPPEIAATQPLTTLSAVRCWRRKADLKTMLVQGHNGKVYIVGDQTMESWSDDEFLEALHFETQEPPASII